MAPPAGSTTIGRSNDWQRVRWRLLADRLPLFALVWFVILVLWMAVYALEARLVLLPAIVLVVCQAAILAVAVALARRDPGTQRVRNIAVAASVLVGITTIVGFGVMGGSGEAAAYLLLTLYLVVALLFAWGWQAELVVFALTIGLEIVALSVQGLLVSPYFIGGGIVIGMIISLLVAEVSRWNLEARLVSGESAARFRGVFDHAPVGMAIVSVDGRLLQVNRSFCEMLGYGERDLLGETIEALTHPDDVAAGVEGMRKLVAGEMELFAFEKRYLHQDGHVVFGLVHCSLIRDRERTPLHFVAQVLDVTERRAREEQLRDSLAQIRRGEEKLRALAARQVVIREQERKRLGLDLHDDVCQELVGIGIHLESLRHRLGPMSTENAATFERVARYLNALVEHLRLLARDLQPLSLHDYGLVDGLRSLASGLSSETVSVSAVLPAEIPRLEESTEVAVYRFAQEAVTNAVRHADASAIDLVVAVEGDILRLEVHDNGCGFERDQCPDALGLVSMEERVLALGGQFLLRSAPGAGTTVGMVCPVGVLAAPPPALRRVATPGRSIAGP